MGYIDYTTQLYRDSFKIHEIRILINQPEFNWKVSGRLFFHGSKMALNNSLRPQLPARMVCNMTFLFPDPDAPWDGNSYQAMFPLECGHFFHHNVGKTYSRPLEHLRECRSIYLWVSHRSSTCCIFRCLLGGMLSCCQFLHCF